MRGSPLVVVVVLVGASCSCHEDGVQPLPDCPPNCPTSSDARHVGRQVGPNPIVAENQQPGDAKWRSGVSARDGELDAFATTDVARAGDRVGVRVNANPPAGLDVTVYRLGYYGGTGARIVAQLPQVQAQTQAACPLDTSTGLLECPWPDTLSFVVGADWVSGLYLVKLSRGDRTFTFAPFVVRDARAAELLFVSAFQTAEAYNRWGGVSLYVDDVKRLPKGRAFIVSYDRPFGESDGAGQLLRWEYPLARYLESQGYDVSYGAGGDFVRFEDSLVGIGMMVAAGHDEYWTAEERDQVDRALDQGRVSLGYFGANGGYWRVRLDPSPDGRGQRRVVCYKDETKLDPQPNSTIRFRDPPDAKPENALFGAWYESFQLMGFPLVVGDTSNWVYEGTGLTRGTLLPGLLGYEFDRVADNGLTPAGTSVVMESPTLTTTGMPEISQQVVRTLPNGRVVFNASSIYFPLAVSTDPEIHDDRVARLVLNVVEKGLAHRRPARALAPPGPQVPAAPAPVGRWATSVAAFAGTVGPPGFADGAASTSRFAGPTGLAALASGAVVVADTGNSRIRLVSADGSTVSTIAGDGLPGSKDGPGTAARFRQPTGVAVLPDGSVVVADQLNHTVRRIVLDPQGSTVTTFAGLALAAGDADGPADVARFNRPSALAVDAAGNVYVADQGGNRVRRIDGVTHVVQTLAGAPPTGDQDAAQGLEARFHDPSAVALAGGALYVYDAGNGRVRRVGLGGTHEVTSIAAAGPRPQGFADGTGDAARFRGQLGMASTALGELLLADTANFRLRLVELGATAADTRVFTVAGSGQLGARLGPGDVADLVAPTGVAVRPDGTVVVSDSYNNVLRLVVR